MRINKIFCFGLLVLVSAVFAQPHLVMGSLRNSDDSYPDPNCVIFEAWMTARPGEILTQNSEGCDVIDTMWFVNIGSFPTEPSDGEELNIWFRDTCLAETLTVTGNVSIPPPQENWGSFMLESEGKSITVTYPNGGELFYWDDPIGITWTSMGIIANVKITYTPNNGTDWFDVVPTTADDGFYSWPAPHITSSQVLFKVEDATDPLTFDVSDDFCSIMEEPDVQMVYPNGGEVFEIDSQITVQWNTSGAVGALELHISRNNGTDWSLVADGLGARGTIGWTVTGPTSDECLMRIREEADTTNFDNSNAVFEIVAPPEPDTTAPAQIITLAAAELEPTRARMTWTDHGDDGNTGTANYYEMFYDDEELVWPGSWAVPGLPAPAAAGTPQEVWIEGLTPNTDTG